MSPIPQSSVEVNVEIGYVPPWAEDIRKEQQEIWYRSPIYDKNGNPRTTVWKLGNGAYFRFPDGIEFIIDQSGTRIWTPWSDSSKIENVS